MCGLTLVITLLKQQGLHPRDICELPTDEHPPFEFWEAGKALPPANFAEDFLHNFEPTLRRRGPDSYGVKQLTRGVAVASSVLGLRGSGQSVVPQPIIDGRSGCILAWNGEVFGGLDMAEDGNDTEALLRELANAAASTAACTVRKEGLE